MTPAGTTISTSYAIDPVAKTIVAQFSQPLQNLSMPPAQAVRMAQILLNCAREVDPASVEGYTWPGMEERPQLTPIGGATAAGKPS